MGNQIHLWVTMLGFISSILPAGNTLCENQRRLLTLDIFSGHLIKSGHWANKKLRGFKIPACQKGCVCFIGQNHEAETFLICDETNDLKLNQIIY